MKNNKKLILLVALATFQGVTMSLVATIMVRGDRENISSTTESSIGWHWPEHNYYVKKKLCVETFCPTKWKTYVYAAALHVCNLW